MLECSYQEGERAGDSFQDWRDQPKGLYLEEQEKLNFNQKYWKNPDSFELRRDIIPEVDQGTMQVELYVYLCQ